MARDWGAVFNTWAQPVSESEAEKAERAEGMIRKAIDASSKLNRWDIRVFAQGSYKNDTNVRQDSDVDIAVCCMDVFIADYDSVPGLSDEQTGNVPATYTQSEFKNEIQEALVDYFGADGIRRGDKAFDVHANTYRLDADVVPCIEHRWYLKDPTDGDIWYVSGVNIRTDSGRAIENYPAQHYKNGCEKNGVTNGTFKRIVRIIKRLRGEMAEAGVEAAKPVTSFLIESLVWNSPDDRFANETYFDDVRAVLVYLYEQLKDANLAKEWCEVNGIKRLWHGAQPWTREQALAFILAAWEHVDFD